MLLQCHCCNSALQPVLAGNTNPIPKMLQEEDDEGADEAPLPRAPANNGAPARQRGPAQRPAPVEGAVDLKKAGDS